MNEKVYKNILKFCKKHPSNQFPVFIFLTLTYFQQNLYNQSVESEKLTAHVMSLQNIIITYNIKVICVLGSANLGSFVYIKHIPGETIQAENI